MILYLFFFAICFVIGNTKNKTLSKFLIGLLFAFLCFGYMTGSDWRAYELDYQYSNYDRMIAQGSIAYPIICELFSKVIKDFWLFAGIQKILHLYALILMIRCFVSKPYYVIGLSFASTLLFMLIDCPMRFMMSMSCIYFAVYVFIKKKGRIKWLLDAILIVLAFLIHTAILPIIAFILTIPLAKFVKIINPVFILVAFLGVFSIIMSSSIFERIFTDIIPFLYEDGFDAYKEYDTAGFLQIGTIKVIVLLVVVLLNRKTIISIPQGDVIYYLALLSVFLQPIVMCVPALFRLNIFNCVFMDMALAVIIAASNKNPVIKASSVLVLLMCVILVGKECKDKEYYTPYSNSIPYIISGNHLPYNYRDNYNPNNHDANYLR